ncbi:hypothetical protein HCN44_006783 [Aphidius gifuensis]|uniref:Uncharacterized protein n=1 Tax=Aphidius gifuensis TaxID=684658 RepID=A0A834Y0H6_APHGI|nr:hypothetical protein HCN44_006783 [Aphidius gifuensis]
MNRSVKNSLRLFVGATKNVTSKTTTWQRSMWHMAKCSNDRKTNLIALTKTQNFLNYQFKRRQHTLADSSKEATKIKIPEYDQPKHDDDETYENVVPLKSKQIFASVDKNGEIIFKTIEGHRIFAAGNKMQIPITEEVFKKLGNESSVKKVTPKDIKNELIMIFYKLTSFFILYYICDKLIPFNKHEYEENGPRPVLVYEENGLRPVLDIFSNVI